VWFFFAKKITQVRFAYNNNNCKKNWKKFPFLGII
jgi:hypothetical protein